MNFACMCCVCMCVMWFCYKINAEIPFFEHDVYSVAIYARFIDVLSFVDADHYTRIYTFFCSCRINGNLCTACIHTEMCVRSLLFFLSLSFFHFVYSMHFSYSSDSLILLESFFLSLSRPVCLSFCHCCCLMKFRYVLNHDACSIPFPP